MATLHIPLSPQTIHCSARQKIVSSIAAKQYKARRSLGGYMAACKSCHSTRQWSCPAEINIHPPSEVENLTKPTVWAFPKLSVCPDCGLVEFVLEDRLLHRLKESYEIK